MKKNGVVSKTFNPAYNQLLFVSNADMPSLQYMFVFVIQHALVGIPIVNGQPQIKANLDNLNKLMEGKWTKPSVVPKEVSISPQYGVTMFKQWLKNKATLIDYAIQEGFITHPIDDKSLRNHLKLTIFGIKMTGSWISNNEEEITRHPQITLTSIGKRGLTINLSSNPLTVKEYMEKVRPRYNWVNDLIYTEFLKARLNLQLEMENENQTVIKLNNLQAVSYFTLTNDEDSVYTVNLDFDRKTSEQLKEEKAELEMIRQIEKQLDKEIVQNETESEKSQEADEASEDSILEPKKKRTKL